MTHQRDAYTAYCFRCDEPGHEKKEVESWQERLDRLRNESATDDSLERSIAPPGPPNFDPRTWPPAAQLWLYRAGCGLPEIRELGAYYHEASGRVVLPVFDGEELIYWQARDVNWSRKSKRAKYINPSVDKQYLVAKFGRGDPLVLTEDVLSAYRVGKLSEAWALMGTSINEHITASIDPGRDVRVWLDPDRAGVQAARAIIKQLTSIGVKASRIKSRADPKVLSSREIHELLRTTPTKQ